MRSSLLFSLALLLLPAHARAQAWDPGPFRSPSPVPRDGLPPERQAFFSWLAAHRDFTQDEGQAVRERLYLYISELAKRQGGRFPSAADTAAFTLFRTAAGLGIVGADRVARALYSDPARLPPPAEVPAFSLTLTPPLFKLSSDDHSWGVCYPYYFMAAPAGRQRPNNGVLTELVILSTLFAPDRGPPGSSQATILIAAAPIADSAAHVATWIGQFRVTPSAPPAEDPAGAWYASAAGDPMHRLLVIRRLPKRVVVVAYIGLGGTFESNRPHFFNLLATLMSGACAA